MTLDDLVPMSEESLAFKYDSVDGTGYDSVVRPCMIIFRLVRLSDGRHYHNVMTFGGYVSYANLSIGCRTTGLRSSNKQFFFFKDFLGEDTENIEPMEYEEAMEEIFDQMGLYFDVLGANVRMMVQRKLDKEVDRVIDERAWCPYEERERELGR